MGVIKGDTRSLDYSSHGIVPKDASLRGPVLVSVLAWGG